MVEKAASDSSVFWVYQRTLLKTAFGEPENLEFASSFSLQ